MQIEGTITRTIDGREVEIPFLISDDGAYFQWGHNTETLGQNVDLLEALAEAVTEFSEGNRGYGDD